MEGKNVAVEADVSDGLPGLILVGYLASEVREGGDRWQNPGHWRNRP